MAATTNRFPDGLPELRAGVYRHYKGGLYQVIGYAQDSTNDLDEPRYVVMYVGLRIPGIQIPGGASAMRAKVREVEEFFDVLHEDGSVCDRTWRPGYRPYTGWCHVHDQNFVERFHYEDVEVPRADH